MYDYKDILTYIYAEYLYINLHSNKNCNTDHFLQQRVIMLVLKENNDQLSSYFFN